jgi:FkbM family methyltransferase
MEAPVNPLHLKIKEGVTLAVRPSLESMTTYVLLEQETWFEKELPFVMQYLRPGMTAIDIGANAGVYSLPMARAVGPAGLVFAYEPAAETRHLLEMSRALNAAGNLRISGLALSDDDRTGHLRHGHSSELHALGDAAAGQGEAVAVTSLDRQCATHNWQAVDFVKIDTEGEEERVFAGGRRLFAEHSPLVMFEARFDDRVNDRLGKTVEDLGYRSFRLLPGLPLLVPLTDQTPVDDFELNLFAAKPQTVSGLIARGMLVEEVAAWKARPSAAGLSRDLLNRQAYAKAFKFDRRQASVDADYEAALAAYAAWRSPSESMARRAGALAFAFTALRALCARTPTPARLSTWARVAWEWGQRTQSVSIVRQLLDVLRRPGVTVNEPFWPASGRFDTIAPVGDPGAWFAAATGDHFEGARAFSSRFGSGSPILKWLCSQPYRTPEHMRRAILLAAVEGKRPLVPAELRRDAAGHLNAEVWRAGLVPGTSA